MDNPKQKQNLPLNAKKRNCCTFQNIPTCSMVLTASFWIYLLFVFFVSPNKVLVGHIQFGYSSSYISITLTRSQSTVSVSLEVFF